MAESASVPHRLPFSFFVDLAAGRGGCVGRDAEELERLRVQPCAVSVERVHEQRLVRADFIEALLFGPAFQLFAGVEAGHVAEAEIRVLLGVGVDVFLDGGQLVVGGGEADEAEVEEVGRSRMDVALDEARQHESALEVHHVLGGILVALPVGRRADEYDLAIADGQGLGHAVLAVDGVDDGVLVVGVHGFVRVRCGVRRSRVRAGGRAAEQAEPGRGGEHGASRQERAAGQVSGMVHGRGPLVSTAERSS